jgi:hypothetical protein
MRKRSSKTRVEDVEPVGEDAVAALLAALGSRPKKSAVSSSKISSSKIKRSGKKQKSTKKPSQAPKKVEKCNAPKLTETDVRLRLMVSNSEPGKCYTLQEIAEVVGVSRERVRQLEFQALRSLRKKMTKILKDDNLEDVDLLKNEYD